MRYFVYPADGFNNWRIIIEQSDGVLIGVRKMRCNGVPIDDVVAGGFYRPNPTWVEVTIEEAIEICKKP